MDESEITLEQVANDWLDPDFEYQGSHYDDLEWSYDYDVEPIYEPGPDLNIPWREQPDIPTNQEILGPYTTEKSWLDELGDFVSDVGPTVVQVAEKYFGAQQRTTSELPTKAPGTSPAIILQTGTGQQTGAANPLFFQTPAAESGTPNLLIYAAIGIAAFYLLR